MLRIGKCDGNYNEESDFRSWAGDLFKALAKRGLLPEELLPGLLALVSIKSASADLSNPSFNVVPMPALKKVGTDQTRFKAPVEAAVQLLAGGDGAMGGERSTVAVTVDLSALPYLQYLPGDHLVVYPSNDAEVRTHVEVRAMALFVFASPPSFFFRLASRQVVIDR